MLASKLEVLVDLGQKPDQQIINKTLNELKSQDKVTEVQFKDGAFIVETTLPSTMVLNMVTKTSGKRAVLQGFGENQSAVAMVSSQSCCNTRVLGVIRFTQHPGGHLVADGSIDGLPPGQHGLHVHDNGDLSQGCASIGGHYRGPGEARGRPHAGDLGNIVADETGRATFRIVDQVLNIYEIIGRSVAVAERPYDSGKGAAASSEDACSGKPIACGIIARSAGVFQNPKRICQCDGVVVWDERDRPLAGAGRRDDCCKERGGKENKPCCKV